MTPPRSQTQTEMDLRKPGHPQPPRLLKTTEYQGHESWQHLHAHPSWRRMEALDGAKGVGVPEGQWRRATDPTRDQPPRCELRSGLQAPKNCPVPGPQTQAQPCTHTHSFPYLLTHTHPPTH